MNEVLKQDDLDPLPFHLQVVLFYAALNGFLSDVPISEMKATEKELFSYMGKIHKESVLDPIREKGTLDEAIEQKLQQALAGFKELIKKQQN